jgi:hypothetical protein
MGDVTAEAHRRDIEFIHARVNECLGEPKETSASGIAQHF